MLFLSNIINVGFIKVKIKSFEDGNKNELAREDQWTHYQEADKDLSERARVCAVNKVRFKHVDQGTLCAP